MYLERIEKEYRYPYLSPKELLSRLEEKGILYLPIGSLEWHNEHLPLGTDTFHAMELSMRLCADIGGVVLPAFWWNTGECHDHATTYHMPEELYRNTFKNTCLGLANIPAKILVLVNGHGGDYQLETPTIIAQEINRTDFPIHIDLDTVDACNLKCKYCTEEHDFIRKRTHKKLSDDMIIDLFKEVKSNRKRDSL